MILALLLAAQLSCNPALTALFTPRAPAPGRYEVCTTADPLERVTGDVSEAPPHYGPAENLEALDAFGAAGPYDRARLARLYGGKRVRVARGWRERPGRFESITLLSPYPDATLTRLLPGTMVITWTLPR
jgi:hypothetical protein